MDRRVAVFVVLALMAAFRVVVAVVAIQGQHAEIALGQASDISRFWDLSHAAGRPYAGYSVEYPPLFLLMLRAIGWFAPGRFQFGAGVIAVSLVAECAAAAVLWRTWGVRALVYFLLVDSLLLGLFAVRLDLVSVALTVAAVAAALRRRPVAAAVLITLAVAMKVWPLFIALLLLGVVRSDVRRRYLVALGLSLAALGAGWMALGGGPAAVTQVLTFRGASGWQIESVIGSVVHLVTGEPVANQAGADRFGHVPAGLSPALGLAAAAVLVWILLRVRRETFGTAWIAAVGAFLVCSTLLSPQYVAWLIPAAAIAWAAGQRVVATAVAGVVALTVVEYLNYHLLRLNDPLAMKLEVVRNAGLVIAIAIAVMRMRSGVRTAEEPAGREPLHADARAA